MPVTNLTEDTFVDTVSKGIVLVDWWAPWCGPCRAFAPVFEAMSERHPDITFAKINTDEEQGLAGAFGISAIPTLMAFRDKVLVFARPGAIPGPALAQLIEQVQKLDMDEVRKAIAEEQSKQAEAGADEK